MWTPQQYQFWQPQVPNIPNFSAPAAAPPPTQPEYDQSTLRPPVPFQNQWNATRIPPGFATPDFAPPPTFLVTEPGIRAPRPRLQEWFTISIPPNIATVSSGVTSSLSPNPPLPPGPPPVGPSATKLLALQVINGGGNLVAGSTELISVLLTDISNVFVSDVPGEGGPVPVPFPASVNITLITPSKTVKVNGAAMTADFSVPGKFDYIYQSVPTDEHGLWLMSFTAADGMGSVGLFPKRPAWNIVHRTMPKPNFIPPAPPPPPPPPPPASTPKFVTDNNTVFFGAGQQSNPNSPVLFTDDLKTYTEQPTLQALCNAAGFKQQYGGDLFNDGKTVIATTFGNIGTCPASIMVWTMAKGWAIPVISVGGVLGGGTNNQTQPVTGPFAIAGNASTYAVGGVDPTGFNAVIWVSAGDPTLTASWTMINVELNASNPIGVIKWIPRLNLFVAIGDDVWTAPTNGTVWTSHTAKADFFSQFYDDGTTMWLVGNAFLWSSTDGVTWTSHAYPASFPGNGPNLGQAIADIALFWDATLSLWLAVLPFNIAHGGGLFWATSPTGVWTQATNVSTDSWHMMGRVGTKLYAAGIRVAATNVGILTSSTDGKTWATPTVLSLPAAFPATYFVSQVRFIGAPNNVDLAISVEASAPPGPILPPVNQNLYSTNGGVTLTTQYTTGFFTCIVESPF